MTRIGHVHSLGLDETLFFRQGRWRRQRWTTSIVDVGAGYLLDTVPGRNAEGPCEWLAKQGQDLLDGIKFAALDLSGPNRKVFDTMIPDATQVADPFHVCKLANQKLDDSPPPGPERTCGHRGRKSDPPYRC